MPINERNYNNESATPGTINLKAGHLLCFHITAMLATFSICRFELSLEILFLFNLLSQALFVPCGSRKKSPRTCN
jgi:hypothetical protein